MNTHQSTSQYLLIDAGSSSCQYNFKNVRDKYDTLDEALRAAALIIEAGKYDDDTGKETGWNYGEGPRHRFNIEEVGEENDLIQGWEVSEAGELI